MARTSQEDAQSLIERASKFDASLAADIRAFAQSREFGLVFEHNRPERMRLYGKPVSVGDVVQVLPTRGNAETVENEALWRVTKIASDTATIIDISDKAKEKTRPLVDLVTVSEYDEPIYAGLKETGRVERGGNKPYQVVINGENYHALESLTFAYAGKVDCIYIDPPYNTGAKDWKYANNYVGGDDAYRHSKWLAYIERRLKIASKLLNPEDSVLIVTIDEKEYLRLGLLLEQTFPNARIQMVTAVVNPSGSSRGEMFSRSDEYIFFVFLGLSKITPTQEDMLHPVIQNREVRWDGLVRRGTTGKRSARPNLFYPIFFSSGDGAFRGVGEPLDKNTDRKDLVPPAGCFAVFPLSANGSEATWGVERRTFIKKQRLGYIKFGPRMADTDKRAVYHLQSGTIKQIENGNIEIKGRDHDGTLVLGILNKPTRPMTTWTKKSFSAGDYGSTLLRSFIPGRLFPFPKSLYAVEDTLRFFISDKPNAVVLDFFAGSGTTAHAVMRLNHQDGGRRYCISITNNEVSAEEENKLTRQGSRHGDSRWEALGICEYVTKPRIKAAITGRTPDGAPIKGDYKFTDEFPMSDGFEENAIFFDLTYQDPDLIELGQAYEQVAPLLWMRASCSGHVVDKEPVSGGFALSDTYAVLFDYAYVNEFTQAVGEKPGLKTVYVVTDDEERYKSVCASFPDRDVVRLYESYLRSFRIAAEGALA